MSLLLSSFLSPPLGSFLSSPHWGWASLRELAAAGNALADTANARKLATTLLGRLFMVQQALDRTRALSNALESSRLAQWRGPSAPFRSRRSSLY